MNDRIDAILCDWARLGILYNVIPAHRTPDIEALLIATAECMPHCARLLPASLAWLAQYERLVARHRLARMVGEVQDLDISAALGLLLEFTRQRTGCDHLNMVIAKCRPARMPKPLFDIDQASPALARLAEAEAVDLACHWGLWTQGPDLKTDIIRPVHWLMAHNPDLRYRAVFSGNLRASVLACLSEEPEAGKSESALARACGATRTALRKALDHLEFCGLVTRQSLGWRNAIKAELHTLVA